MNKNYSTVIAVLLTVTFPLSAFSQDVLTPAMIVRPYDIKAQKQEIEQLIADAVDLSKKVESKEQDLTVGQAMFRDYGQYDHLRRILNGYLEQIEARDKKLESQESQINDLRKQLNEIRNSLNVVANAPVAKVPVENDRKADTSMNQRLQAELDQKNQVLIQQEERLARLRNELADVKNPSKELPGQAAQLTELKEEVVRTKEALKAADLRYDELLKKSSQDNFNKADEIAKTDKMISENNAKLEDLKNKFDADLRSKDQEIANLKTQLAKAMNDIKNLTAELAKDDTAFAAIRERGLTLKEELKAKTNEIEANRNSLMKMQERARLQAQLDLLRFKRLALIEQKSQLLKRQAAQIKEQSGIFIERISMNSTLLNAQKQKSDTEIQELQKSIKESQEKIAALSQDVARKDVEKQDLYRLVDRFKSRLKETADVNNDQGQALALYKAQIDQYHDQQKTAMEEMQMKEERVADLLKELDRIKAALADAKEQVKAKDLSLSMVQSMTDEKSKVNETLITQLKDQVKLSQDQLAQIKEKLAVVEAKLEQGKHDEEIPRLQGMLKSSREEIIQLNSLIKLKEGQIKGLQAGLDVNAKEFESQNNSLERIKLDLSKQKNDIDKLSDDLLWKQREVTRLKLQLKETTKVVAVAPTVSSPVKVVEIKGDHEQLRNELKDSKEQIATLKEKLAQTQNVVRFLEKKLRSPRTDS